MDARDERLARRFRQVRDADAMRDDCPPAERIWEAAHGKLGGRDERSVVDHLATCSVCRESWRLARDLEKPENREEIPRRPMGWSPLVAAAAGILLVIGLWPTRESAIRDDAEVDPCAGFAPTVGAADGSDRVEVVFGPFGEAGPYEIDVFTVDEGGRKVDRVLAGELVTASEELPAVVSLARPPGSPGGRILLEARAAESGRRGDVVCPAVLTLP